MYDHLIRHMEGYMTFSESISTCLRKYSDFRGRASLSEFWWYFLFYGLLGAGIAILGPTLGIGVKLILKLAHLILSMPYLSVMTRRLHDVNRSGWWLLIGVTIIGMIPLLYWLSESGDAQANKYGAAVQRAVSPGSSAA